MANLLRAGLSASLLIGIAGLLRLTFGKKIPSGAFFLLWRLIILRLLFLFSIPVEVFWLGSSSIQPNMTWNSEPVALPKMGNSGTTLVSQNPIPASLTSDFSWPDLFFWIWLIGIVVTAALLVISHFRWRRIYATALPANCLFPGKFRRKILVKKSDRIPAPLTYGLLHPVILLPEGTDPTSLSCILAHEAVHIRRLDNGFQWLMATALCFHWMNPLVWVLAFFFNRDMELSCDEAVLRSMDPSDRKAYVNALLTMEERRCPPLSAGFSKHPTKERIVSIMNLKPNTLPRVIIAVAAVAAISLLSIATVLRPIAPKDALAAPEDAASSLLSSDNPDDNSSEESSFPDTSSPDENLTGNTPVERREGDSDEELLIPPSSEENAPKIAELPEGQLETPEQPSDISGEIERQSGGEETNSEEPSLILPISQMDAISYNNHHSDHHSGHHSTENNVWVSCGHGQNGHCGMDIACPSGTCICAAGAGTVVQAGWDNNYGNCVVIDHGNGLQTRYGHNSQLLVSAGDTVSQGQQIAQSGSTGLSTGPHCHFEVLQDGESCDPMGYVNVQ